MIQRLRSAIDRHQVFLRYAMTGGVSTSIDLLVVAGLTWRAVTPSWAVSVGFYTGVVVNYLMHHYFTFQRTDQATIGRFLPYLCVVFANYLVTLAVVSSFLLLLPNQVLLGKVVSLPLVVMVGYLGTKRFVFK